MSNLIPAEDGLFHVSILESSGLNSSSATFIIARRVLAWVYSIEDIPELKPLVYDKDLGYATTLGSLEEYYCDANNHIHDVDFLYIYSDKIYIEAVIEEGVEFDLKDHDKILELLGFTPKSTLRDALTDLESRVDLLELKKEFKMETDKKILH